MKSKATVTFIAIALCVAFGWLPILRASAESSDNKRIRMAAVLYTENNPFWFSVWEGVRAAAADLRIDLSEYQYANNDLEAENMLETAILARVDVILLRMSNEYSARTSALIQGAKAKGIRIAIMDTNDYAEYCDVHISIDNQGMASALADAVERKHEPGTGILIIKLFSSSSTTVIRQGEIEKRLAQKGLFDMVRYLHLPESEELWARSMQNYLLENEDIVSVVCTGPKATLLAANTISGMGLTGRVRVFGFCETKEALDFTKEGTISALIAQKTYEMGYFSTQLANDIVLGKTLPTKNHTIDTLLIDIHNVQEGYKMLRLFPD